MRNECHRLIRNQIGNVCAAQHFCRVFINPLALVTWVTKVAAYTSNGILGSMGALRSTGNLCSRSNLGKKGIHKSNLVKWEQRSKDNPGNEGQHPCNIGNDGNLTMNGNVRNHGTATAAVDILKNKASMGILIT
jgi:hypothetical protein